MRTPGGNHCFRGAEFRVSDNTPQSAHLPRSGAKVGVFPSQRRYVSHSRPCCSLESRFQRASFETGIGFAYQVATAELETGAGRLEHTKDGASPANQDA